MRSTRGPEAQLPVFFAVIVLVGGGQEINTGEAGLPEWFDSLRRAFPDWDVYITPQLNDAEYRREREWQDMIADLNIIEREKLHLATSVRSFRTPDLAAFVKAVLDVDVVVPLRGGAVQDHFSIRL